MSRLKFLLAAACAVLGLALAAPAAQALSLGPEEPHSPNAETIASTYWVMLVVGVALIVAINAGLVVAVVRFRERRGREPSRFAAGRGALRPVIGALSVLALAIFAYGVIATENVREVEPTGPGGLDTQQTAQVGIKLTEGGEPAPLEINAIAQQWTWRFEYPGSEPAGQRNFSYGELVVPVDTAVVLNVTSTDVVHTWWVPALGGQVQATPNQVSETWFRADEEGRYAGRSTTFSGTGYPSMRAWVRVVSVPEYEDYVEQLTEDLDAAQGFISERQLEEASAAAGEPEAGATGEAP